jgi:hypothetical protein
MGEIDICCRLRSSLTERLLDWINNIETAAKERFPNHKMDNGHTVLNVNIPISWLNARSSAGSRSDITIIADAVVIRDGKVFIIWDTYVLPPRNDASEILVDWEQ